jgi:hypothetical protein
MCWLQAPPSRPLRGRHHLGAATHRFLLCSIGEFERARARSSHQKKTSHQHLKKKRGKEEGKKKKKCPTHQPLDYVHPPRTSQSLQCSSGVDRVWVVVFCAPCFFFVSCERSLFWLNVWFLQHKHWAFQKWWPAKCRIKRKLIQLEFGFSKIINIGLTCCCVRIGRPLFFLNFSSLQPRATRSISRSKVRDVIMKVRRRINHKDMVQFYFIQIEILFTSTDWSFHSRPISYSYNCYLFFF